jgi:hypothetical protein
LTCLAFAGIVRRRHGRSHQFARLRAAESVGRPLGDDRFLARIERLTGRLLKPGKRGPKPATAEL